MRRFWRLGGATLSLLSAVGIAACTSSAPDGSASWDGGATIALHTGTSNSDKHAVIDTMIAGQSQSLLFDTGSVGISVLQDFVPASVKTLAGPSFEEEFGGGVVLSGKVVSAPVSLPGVPTTKQISIRLVQSASCSSQLPKCAAKGGLKSFSTSIGADGIFGAGFWAESNLSSPLLQLSPALPSSIAVHWDGGSGWVKLGATTTTPSVATLQMPAANPATLPDGQPAWNNLGVPMCWKVANAKRTCESTALDTGASAMVLPVDFPGAPTSPVNRLPAGQTISAAVTVEGPPFFTFKTGSTLGVDLVTAISNQSMVDSGIQLFGNFTVEFTPGDGSVRLFTP